MEVGDIISSESAGGVFLVRKILESTGTVYLENQIGEQLITDVSLAHKVESTPAKDWPGIQTPLNRKGRVIRVEHGSRRLARLLDWVKLDDFQLGGLIYFNPALNLMYGQRLVAVYGDVGRETRIPLTVPKGFKPFTEKVIPPKKSTEPETKTLYDCLMDDEL